MKKITLCSILTASLFAHISAAETNQWNHESFALKLFQTAAQNPNENFVISPYSVASAFGVAASGAKGETADEMQKALGFSKCESNEPPRILANERKEIFTSTNENARLELSNSLWPEMSFTLGRSFVSQAVKLLDAKVQPIPMNSVGQKMINDAVCKATHGRIPTTLSMPPSAATRLILISTIYFNGKWQSPFRAEDVDELPFATPTGKVTVPFLTKVRSFPLYEDPRFSLLRMPYRGANFEMVFILPKAGLPLADFERSLTIPKLRTAIDDANWTRTDIEIPKFEFNATISLNSTMRKMGMKRAFTPSADFSGMSKKEGKELFISDAFQKANITVDEEGTIASAVTGIAMMAAAMPPTTPPREFHANHPFLFLIRHIGTNQILFMGRVAAPTPPAKKTGGKYGLKTP